jgi:hypothetical protein
MGIINTMFLVNDSIAFEITILFYFYFHENHEANEKYYSYLIVGKMSWAFINNVYFLVDSKYLDLAGSGKGGKF